MKPGFKPPRISPFICNIFVWPNRLFFSRDVTWKIDDESFSRWKKIPRDAGLLICVKHAHQNDQYFIFELAARLGVFPYYTSVPEVFSDYWGVGGWFARRFGGFAVERGGRNVQATRFVVQTLSKGEAPIVIFPEGELFYLNDVVTPLKAGSVYFALEAAKARAEAGKPNSMFILPVGLKYFYPADASSLLEKHLSRLEKDLFGAASDGPILPRIQGLTQGILERGQIRFGMTVTGKNCEERFLALSRSLVEQMEREAGVKTPAGDLSDRARHLMEETRADEKKFNMAFWALYTQAFLPGYLDNPTQERLMETLRKSERLITGNETPSFPGHKLHCMKIEEPILADEYLPKYLERGGKKQAMEALTARVQFSIQQSVNALLADHARLFAGPRDQVSR